MKAFFDWLTTWHVGDLAGIAGLIVSVGGFAITIRQIRRSKSVSEQVQASIIDVRRELEQRSIAVDLRQLIRDLEEVKLLQRLNAPQVLPGRYTSIRSKLIEVRATYSFLTFKQKALIQGSISQLSELERILELGKANYDPGRLNQVVNAEIDKVVELLSVLQNKSRRRI